MPARRTTVRLRRTSAGSAGVSARGACLRSPTSYRGRSLPIPGGTAGKLRLGGRAPPVEDCLQRRGDLRFAPLASARPGGPGARRGTHESEISAQEHDPRHPIRMAFRVPSHDRGPQERPMTSSRRNEKCLRMPRGRHMRVNRELADRSPTSNSRCRAGRTSPTCGHAREGLEVVPLAQAGAGTAVHVHDRARPRPTTR